MTESNPEFWATAAAISAVFLAVSLLLIQRAAKTPNDRPGIVRGLAFAYLTVGPAAVIVQSMVALADRDPAPSHNWTAIGTAGLLLAAAIAAFVLHDEIH
ncbi:hypothetical protein [Desertimonas flava]|uniref:hypothetical protein n=1 Tax=Desertimonas flava TaxID=2064846 RepID=UPI000E3468AB|nr:hypothetical protein [Desertimonas flava]